MSSDTYRVWLKDDWGMEFVAEIPAHEAAVVLSYFDSVPVGRSIVLI